MDSWAQEFGGDRPSGMSELMGEVVQARLSHGMSDNQRAAAAWYSANGDRERAHTTGVFLKRPRGASKAPVLGVYVDSHVMVTDMSVNKDIYLARLANIGFAVSGIDFVVSREGYRKRSRQASASGRDARQELPALDAAELARVRELVSKLPDDLQDAASKAMIASMRRQKEDARGGASS